MNPFYKEPDLPGPNPFVSRPPKPVKVVSDKTVNNVRRIEIAPMECSPDRFYSPYLPTYALSSIPSPPPKIDYVPPTMADEYFK